MRRSLIVHPDSPAGAVSGVTVELERGSDRQLRLLFRLAGRLGELALPGKATPEHTDGLWRHTCFETFIAPAAGGAYYEFNLSPSTQWAAYGFDGYRSGMRPLNQRVVGEVATEVVGEAELQLSAALDLSPLTALRGAWRLGLCAVIEAADGQLSYWALRHPPGRADFHHVEGFHMTLNSGDKDAVWA